MTIDNSGAHPPVVPATKANGRVILAASWSMLKADKQLLWVPFLSGVASVTAAVLLFVPGFLVGRTVGGTDDIGGYVGGALAAFAASVVAIYFQAALIIGANQRAEGRQPTLRGVLGAAWRLRVPILGWALLTTTVGLAMRALEERLGFLGKLFGFLGGLAWAIVSFLVVPVVVVEGLGPVAAVRRSSQLLRDTWGTSLRTTLRFGLLQVLVWLGLIAALVVGLVLAFTGPLTLTVAGVLLVVASILGFVGMVAVFSAISTYARAVIYRYAAGLPTPGVPEAALAGAFTPKKRRR
ncbi:DUF6159 family protein [Nocardioides jiangxiensis]|uniref:DUF6159 family protein n=1 Tax=Nocardioides jiangxiensis TaxID=3064524 RepID=A0ABT9B8W8_9ACTN|nr:DUF6159 family protein [Nocardioides sp. WY-20]MDO7869598.1 DUF6159 family protein [Nocardioides sp. WY-20]